MYCGQKYITNKSSSTSTAETISLIAPPNCWCIVRWFRYLDVTYINIHGIDTITYQTDGDSSGKVSFVNIFPVRKGTTVSIKKPTNSQKGNIQYFFMSDIIFLKKMSIHRFACMFQCTLYYYLCRSRFELFGSYHCLDSNLQNQGCA